MKYWVGGAGTWDVSTTTHWSDSDGGAGGAVAPASTDDVTFNANSGLGSGGTVTVAATAVCRNWTLSGINSNIVYFSFSGNPTFSGAMSWQGNSETTPILFQSNTVGTQRTITLNGSHGTHAYIHFQDIKLAGSAGVLTGTLIGDCGGNDLTTITVDSSTNRTCTMGTNKNWSDTTIWTGSHIPLPQDDCFMSAITGGTLTANQPRLGRSIDWTGASGSPTWSNSITTTSYGSWTANSNVTYVPNNTHTLAGRSNFYITSNGATSAPRFIFGVTTASNYTMLDAFAYSGTTSLGFIAGTLTVNGSFLSAGALSIAFSTGLARTLNMGNGVWNFTTTAGTFWSNLATSLLTINPGSAEIKWNTATASTLTFAGGTLAGGNYPTLTYTVAGSTGELDITGSNSFAQINFSDASNARTLKFTAGTTTTIRNGKGFNVQGTNAKLMTVTSSVTPTGRWGDAISLTGGTAAYSAVDHADFKPTGNFSISGWFKTSTAGANQFMFASYAADAALGGITFLISSTNKLRCVSAKNTGNVLGTDYQEIVGGTTVTDGNWHFGVVTWDGSNLKLYVDGNSDTANVAWANAPAYKATNYVRIGCRNLTGSNVDFYTGLLDDLAVWNGKALSSTEVTALYTDELNHNALISDGSLKAYYRFETGALTTDTTAGAHTLTAIGSPAGTGAGYTITSPSLQSCDYLSLAGAKVDNSPKWYGGSHSTDAFGNNNWIFTDAPYVIQGSRSGVGLQAINNLQNLQRLA